MKLNIILCIVLTGCLTSCTEKKSSNGLNNDTQIKTGVMLALDQSIKDPNILTNGLYGASGNTINITNLGDDIFTKSNGTSYGQQGDTYNKYDTSGSINMITDAMIQGDPGKIPLFTKRGWTTAHGGFENFASTLALGLSVASNFSFSIFSACDLSPQQAKRINDYNSALEIEYRNVTEKEGYRSGLFDNLNKSQIKIKYDQLKMLINDDTNRMCQFMDLAGRMHFGIGTGGLMVGAATDAIAGSILPLYMTATHWNAGTGGCSTYDEIFSDSDKCRSSNPWNNNLHFNNGSSFPVLIQNIDSARKSNQYYMHLVTPNSGYIEHYTKSYEHFGIIPYLPIPNAVTAYAGFQRADTNDDKDHKTNGGGWNTKWYPARMSALKIAHNITDSGGTEMADSRIDYTIRLDSGNTGEEKYAPAGDYQKLCNSWQFKDNPLPTTKIPTSVPSPFPFSPDLMTESEAKSTTGTLSCAYQGVNSSYQIKYGDYHNLAPITIDHYTKQLERLPLGPYATILKDYQLNNGVLSGTIDLGINDYMSIDTDRLAKVLTYDFDQMGISNQLIGLSNEQHLSIDLKQFDGYRQFGGDGVVLAYAGGKLIALPLGKYLDTCDNSTYDGNTGILSARCLNDNSFEVKNSLSQQGESNTATVMPVSSIYVNPDPNALGCNINSYISNNNGTLFCTPSLAIPRGEWALFAVNIINQDGVYKADIFNPSTKKKSTLILPTAETSTDCAHGEEVVYMSEINKLTCLPKRQLNDALKNFKLSDLRYNYPVLSFNNFKLDYSNCKSGSAVEISANGKLNCTVYANSGSAKFPQGTWFQNCITDDGGSGISGAQNPTITINNDGSSELNAWCSIDRMYFPYKKYELNLAQCWSPYSLDSKSNTPIGDIGIYFNGKNLVCEHEINSIPHGSWVDACDTHNAEYLPDAEHQGFGILNTRCIADNKIGYYSINTLADDCKANSGISFDGKKLNCEATEKNDYSVGGEYLKSCNPFKVSSEGVMLSAKGINACHTSTGIFVDPEAQTGKYRCGYNKNCTYGWFSDISGKYVDYDFINGVRYFNYGAICVAGSTMSVYYNAQNQALIFCDQMKALNGFALSGSRDLNDSYGVNTPAGDWVNNCNLKPVSNQLLMGTEINVSCDLKKNNDIFTNPQTVGAIDLFNCKEYSAINAIYGNDGVFRTLTCITKNQAIPNGTYLGYCKNPQIVTKNVIVMNRPTIKTWLTVDNCLNPFTGNYEYVPEIEYSKCSSNSKIQLTPIYQGDGRVSMKLSCY